MSFRLLPSSGLLLASATLFATQAEPGSEPHLLRQPAIFGDTIVYVHAGDLWVTTVNGGPARRLTSHPGLESRPHISPDGKWVAFTGMYDGNQDVYVIPLAGGEPRRLTYEPQPDAVIGWTPDGRIGYASNFGSPSYRTNRLWTVSPKGDLPKPTPIEEITEGSFLDGDTVIYNRFSMHTANWRHYRGGTQGRVSVYNFKTNAYRELPTNREQNYWPMVAGRTVLYASDKRLDTLNLYQYNLDTNKEVALTQFTDADVRWPSTDGKRVAFERDGQLFVLDLATKAVTPVRPTYAAENLTARPTLRNLNPFITAASVSPSGTRVVVEARGELFSIPTKQGDTRNLTTTSGARERYSVWSPDGKTIAFLREDEDDKRIVLRSSTGADESILTKNLPVGTQSLEWSPDGKYLIVTTRGGGLSIVDVAAKTTKEVQPSGTAGIVYDVSPDGKWIAYTVTLPSFHQSVRLYKVEDGTQTQVTNGYYNDLSVAFDTNGRFLYLLSERTFNQEAVADGFNMDIQNAARIYALPLRKDEPNPLIPASDEEGVDGPKPPEGNETKIDLDGLAGRAIPLPIPAGAFGGIAGSKNGVLVFTGDGIQRFDLGTRTVQPIWSGSFRSANLNAKRTHLALVDGNGQVKAFEIHPGVGADEGKIDTSRLSAVIDPRAEWREIFWESWRWYRDYFYDPAMRGLNWREVGDRYAKYLPYVDHRTDLNEVIGRMIAELGTGHSYIRGGDMGTQIPMVPTGLLGADYRAVNGKIVFGRIYRGDAADEDRLGPLAGLEGQVNEGDTLLAIDGSPVDELNPPSKLLVNKANTIVTLTVSRSGSGADAKQIRVMTTDDESHVRYATWVEDNRQKVLKLSNGRIGYLHVPDTAAPGAAEFARGFRGQTDKDALIVDERNNSGGNLPWFYIERLMRRPIAASQSRLYPDQVVPFGAMGPKVILINQNAGSGGDMFPFLFRAAGLGELIGTRTWGGLVGYSGEDQLVDGGVLNAPDVSFYDPATNKIVAENTGVDPDIEVDNRPDQVKLGRDPQLEKAVEVLMAKLAKLPAKPVRTKVPTPIIKN